MTTPEEMKALEKGLEAAKEYADCVLKQPLSGIGGILADTIGTWRLKNQIRLLLKTKQWLENQDIEPSQILPDIFVPLLEEAGNCANEDLSDMFASLLAAHLDPNVCDAVHPSFAKVLSQLSAIDARTLLIFRKYTSHTKAREIGFRGLSITVEYIANEIETHAIMPVYLSCLNLWRLGVVEYDGFLEDDNAWVIPNLKRDVAKYQQYRITEYGVAFADTCSPESRKN